MERSGPCGGGSDGRAPPSCPAGSRPRASGFSQACFVVPVLPVVRAYNARGRPPAAVRTDPTTGVRVPALYAVASWGTRHSPPPPGPPAPPASGRTTAVTTVATTKAAVVTTTVRPRPRPRPRPRAALQSSSASEEGEGVQAAAPTSHHYHYHYHHHQQQHQHQQQQQQQRRRSLVYGAGGFRGYGDAALDEPLDEEVASYFSNRRIPLINHRPLSWYSQHVRYIRPNGI